MIKTIFYFFLMKMTNQFSKKFFEMCLRFLKVSLSLQCSKHFIEFDDLLVTLGSDDLGSVLFEAWHDLFVVLFFKN